MNLLKWFWDFIKVLFYLFLFLGAMTSVLIGLLGLVMEPGSIFSEAANITFIAIMLIPTGFSAMMFLATKAFEAARPTRFDWEMFEEGKRMTKTVRNPLLDLHEETTVICDIYRRPTGTGVFEYKTVERYNK